MHVLMDSLQRWSSHRVHTKRILIYLSLRLFRQVSTVCTMVESRPCVEDCNSLQQKISMEALLHFKIPIHALIHHLKVIIADDVESLLYYGK
jgi:hypothetical protein